MQIITLQWDRNRNAHAIIIIIIIHNPVTASFILGHIAHMDDDADAKMILTAPTTGNDHQGILGSRG